MVWKKFTEYYPEINYGNLHQKVKEKLVFRKIISTMDFEEMGIFHNLIVHAYKQGKLEQFYFC